ncbi:hypothetical protein TL16_g02405, partial [Triparma laevis f. inornata]
IKFVTGNKKKVEEVKALMGDVEGVEIDNVKLDLPELQGSDAIEIARQKCMLAAKEVGGAVITEDTSLCFNALGGLPGPYIRWFLESCGHEGLNKMLDGFEDRSAYAQTIVAFCEGEGQEVLMFNGRTEGTIVPARGSKDFGWDAIFEVDGKTYGEMNKEEKNEVSHRGKAFLKFKE